MVVHRPTDDELDRLFHALADRTRRDILRRALGGGALSVSELAETYPMSFAAVQKHVAVLERAGLVHKRRDGRAQRVGGDPEALQTVHRLLDELEAHWRGRIEQIGALLAEEPQEDER
ncbi:MAG: metalloregulator ArsR/SmtB family transcription factor [Myxococcota bacterium]